ncbi:hypothetical protein QBC40DRAFT_294743 [Triangularia verruculosa]|uniref:Uncharacterized protein n=1 Tax=Triangularia verruculosa TaxID=2587418 RepID=A0AAN7AVB0_9PEZI|nr:hypothetical protein QBC40DRAFT_294743 [Triangularia verruculosa]
MTASCAFAPSSQSEQDQRQRTRVDAVLEISLSLISTTECKLRIYQDPKAYKLELSKQTNDQMVHRDEDEVLEVDRWLQHVFAPTLTSRMNRMRMRRRRGTQRSTGTGQTGDPGKPTAPFHVSVLGAPCPLSPIEISGPTFKAVISFQFLVSVPLSKPTSSCTDQPIDASRMCFRRACRSCDVHWLRPSEAMPRYARHTTCHLRWMPSGWPVQKRAKK